MKEERRLLFVGEDQRFCERMRSLLAARGDPWVATRAPDGAQALALLGAAPFDLVIAESAHGHADGVAVLSRVARRHPMAVRMLCVRAAGPRGGGGASRGTSRAGRSTVNVVPRPTVLSS